jgi:mannose-6-phosphate isomerase
VDDLMASPQQLPANQFDHFYRGGNRIGKLRGGPGGPMRPEEWIGSITTRFGEKDQGLSKLASGDFLIDAIKADPVGWLGQAHLDAFGPSTELLCKLLDPDQDLPVHFHPNREFAKAHLGLSHGKTEAWIILEAPAGATVGLGFKKDMTLAEVHQLVKDKSAAALINSLNHYPVSAGDTVLVPAGVPHSIGKNIFVLELQEPTDLSILLEWEKFAVDGEKDGHLGLGFDLALQALTLNALSVDLVERLIIKKAFPATVKRSVFSAEADPFFRCEFVPVTNGRNNPGFAILLMLRGSGEIDFNDGTLLPVEAGDAIVVPHCAGSWVSRGVEHLVARPPANS